MITTQAMSIHMGCFFFLIAGQVELFLSLVLFYAMINIFFLFMQRARDHCKCVPVPVPTALRTRTPYHALAGSRQYTIGLLWSLQ